MPLGGKLTTRRLLSVVGRHPGAAHERLSSSSLLNPHCRSFFHTTKTPSSSLSSSSSLRPPPLRQSDRVYLGGYGRGGGSPWKSQTAAASSQASGTAAAVLPKSFVAVWSVLETSLSDMIVGRSPPTITPAVTLCDSVHWRIQRHEEKYNLVPPSKTKSWKMKVRRALRMLVRAVQLMFTLVPLVALFPFFSGLLTTSPTKNEGNTSIVVNQTTGLIEDPWRPKNPGSDDDSTTTTTTTTITIHEDVNDDDDYNDDDELDSSTTAQLRRAYLRLCLRCVEWSGAAVIKLMQWASSREDLMGRDFCRIFSHLQDNTTPHSLRHTEAVLERAYGKNWQSRIELDGGLIGSGCIGQVYRGHVRLTDGQRQEVAVKVMHPNIRSNIDADLDLMRLGARIVNTVLPNMQWFDLAGAVEEFASLLTLQLDFRMEAENLIKFNENFKDDPDVMFPKLIRGYDAHRDVLIETFCRGTPVLQFAKQSNLDDELKTKLCSIGIRTVTKMIFEHNFIHGDLHPGNIFVSDDHKFILLDAGMVTEYGEDDHERIVSILASFVRNRGRVAGRLLIDDSNTRQMQKYRAPPETTTTATKQQQPLESFVAVEEEAYIDKIESMVTKANGPDFFMENLGTYISFICDAAVHHRVMLNPAFVSAALAIKVQESIVLALDPHVEIWRIANPIIVNGEVRRNWEKMRRRMSIGSRSSSSSSSDEARAA